MVFHGRRVLGEEWAKICITTAFPADFRRKMTQITQGLFLQKICGNNNDRRKTRAGDAGRQVNGIK